MIQLINILLEVSRIEAGRMVLRREPVRLDVLTEELINSFAPYARASNIVLEFASPAEISPAAGDPERLKMVIQNLLDNAIRYSRSGGRVATTITPAGPRAIEWRVRDEGMGISSAERRYIFQKFFRSANARRQQAQGSGLGLYIARSVIEALGGEIGFESEEHQGSTFWFRLPAYEKAH